MDYKKKYLQYKLKYLNIKNILKMKGGNDKLKIFKEWRKHANKEKNKEIKEKAESDILEFLKDTESEKHLDIDTFMKYKKNLEECNKENKELKKILEKYEINSGNYGDVFDVLKYMSFPVGPLQDYD